MSKGYALQQCVYVSNEHAYQMDVYFDDVTMTRIPSLVVQQEDFYPGGLTFNSYSRENSVKQDYLYNGKELQDELGLNWEDYGARMYMPEIGRWGVIDNMTEFMRKWSPYSYAFNNPIVFEDRDGNIPWPKIFGKNKTAKIGDRGFSSTPVLNPYTKKTSPHEAVDLAAPEGTPIRALAQGKVLKVGYDDTNGNYVQIDHGDGYMTMYDHIRNSGVKVKEGQEIKDGQLIAEVGSTGGSTGPHLHLMMFKNGKKIDPTSINDLQEKLHPDTGEKSENETGEKVSEDLPDFSKNTSPEWAKKSKIGAYIYFFFTGKDSGLPDFINDQNDGTKYKQPSYNGNASDPNQNHGWKKEDEFK